jgi:serine/threonine protein kinase
MQGLLQSEIQVIIEMDHPNVIKFYQCVYDNRYVNIVMELVKGKTLAEYIIERQRLPEREC